MKMNEFHLNEDEIISAVVDETELSAGLRRHLDDCPPCLERKQRLEGELNRLGCLTQNFAPEPRRRIRVEKPKPRSIWLPRPIFATALVLVLILIAGIWRMGPFNVPGDENIAGLIREAPTDRQLTTEISELVENTLPDYYLDIIGESYQDDFDDFLRFVTSGEDNPNTV